MTLSQHGVDRTGRVGIYSVAIWATLNEVAELH